MDRNNQEISLDQALVPEERRRRIENILREHGSVTVAMLEDEFGVSSMTARRDLDTLERKGKLLRTHGGAILPRSAAHEDSFQHRLHQAVDAKERLARTAFDLLEPGESVFIDSSSTAYYLVKEILGRRLRVTLLTNLAPAIELFTTGEPANAELVGMGGAFRELTLSFVGPHAVRTVGAHFADKVFFSVKGVTPGGHLTIGDSLEAEVKRTMIEHSAETFLMIDGSKFDQRGLSSVVHLSEVDLVLAADVSEEQIETVKRTGVAVRVV